MWKPAHTNDLSRSHVSCAHDYRLQGAGLGHRGVEDRLYPCRYDVRARAYIIDQPSIPLLINSNNTHTFVDCLAWDTCVRGLDRRGIRSLATGAQGRGVSSRSSF